MSREYSSLAHALHLIINSYWMDSEILSGLENHIPGINKVSNDDELDVLLEGLDISDRLAKIRACKNLIKHAASTGSTVSSVSLTSAIIPKPRRPKVRLNVNPPIEWKPLVALPSDLEGRPTSFYGNLISPHPKAIKEGLRIVDKDVPMVEPEKSKKEETMVQKDGFSIVDKSVTNADVAKVCRYKSLDLGPQVMVF
jgi:hypothetical protein